MTRRPARGSVVVMSIFAAAIAAATVLCSLFWAATHDVPPVPEPDRVALIWKHDSTAFRQRRPLTLGEFRLLGDSAPTFAAIAASSERQALIDGPARRAVTVEQVAGGFFDVARPAGVMGRLPSPSEVRTASRVTVISFPLWRDLFGGDPGAVGQWLTIGGDRYEVIGIMPDRFWFPWRGGGAGIWIPFPATAPLRDGVQVTARLAPRGTMSAAAGQLGAAALHHHIGFPSDRAPIVVAPIADEARIKAGPGLIGLIAPSMGILIVAWANAAMLLLIGCAGRQRELAARMALGASRARLVIDSLAGTARVVIAAGLAGGVGAYWLKALLAHLVEQVNPTQSAALQGGVLLIAAIAIGLALLTIPAAGLFPALVATRRDLTSMLAGRDPALRLVRRQYGAGDGLLVLQVALAMGLVLGAAFLLRAFHEIQTVGELRYDARRILAAPLPNPTPRVQALYAARAASLPGVEAVALVSSLPGPLLRSSRVSVSDDAGSRDCLMATVYATRNIFDALAFGPRGAMPPGTLVASETAVRRCWSGRRVHAQARVAVAGHTALWLPVSAVVPDAYGESPLADSSAAGGTASASQLYVIVEAVPAEADSLLLVRTRDPAATRDALTRLLPRETAAMVDLADSGFRRRIEEMAVPVSGLIAIAGFVLLLAACGVHAAFQYAVIAHTTEIGIRRAIGAPAVRIVSLVVTHHGPIILVGIAVGLGGATLLTDVLWRNLLLLARSDLRMAVGVGIVLIGAGAAALAGPVARALRINPADVLRAQ